MGRTLHFTISKDKGKFTTKEKQSILDIANKYNSGPFEKIWTCENYYLTAHSGYYPNWKKLKSKGVTEAWNTINKRQEELLAEGKTEIETYKILYNEGMILFSSDPNGNKFHSFCKTQGNELNSMLVYLALIELSVAIPKALITLSDEGRFLYCDVRIKNGKVQPVLSALEESIRHFCQRIVMHNSQPFLKQFNPLNLPEGLIKDIGLDGSPYDVESSIKYINEKIFDMNEVYKRIKDKITAKYHCIHNIEPQWFSPELLCRTVKPEDFAGFEGGAKQLMGGFYGEYFKLSSKDAESESYRSIGLIQKILDPALQISGSTMEILPKIGNIK